MNCSRASAAAAAEEGVCHAVIHQHADFSGWRAVLRADDAAAKGGTPLRAGFGARRLAALGARDDDLSSVKVRDARATACEGRAHAPDPSLRGRARIAAANGRRAAVGARQCSQPAARE